MLFLVIIGKVVNTIKLRNNRDFSISTFFSVAFALRCKRCGESIIQYLKVFAVFPLFVEITIISQLWRRQITHVKHKVSLFAHFLHHDVERGTN